MQGFVVHRPGRANTYLHCFVVWFAAAQLGLLALLVQSLRGSSRGLVDVALSCMSYMRSSAWARIAQMSILGAAAELGPLASLLLAPEEGSWGVDEVTVSSSRTGHTDRFVCKEPLGAAGAGFLSPVPPGAVVYGSGETAVVLTKVRARWQAVQLGGSHRAGVADGRAAQDRPLTLASSW